jgi:hypothetical protein
MVEDKRTLGIYAVLAWMIFNVIFYSLELTILNDSADLNNSIMLVLWIISIIGILSMRKLGATLATSTLIYAASFNTFNVIYYQLYLVNGTSAIINIIAAGYLFKIIFANKFR